MTAVLKAIGLWKVVNGEEKAEGNAAWEGKDIDAQALIIPTLEANQAGHVYTCKTSKEIWDRLVSLHADSSILNRTNTWASFFEYKVQSGGSLVQAYSDLEQIALSLREMGMQVEDSMVVTKIVSSLPPEHTAFKKAWDSVATSEQTMVNLLARIQKEEMETQSQMKRSGGHTGAAYSANTKMARQKQVQEWKKESPCARCGEVGHWKNECPEAGNGGQWKPSDFGGRRAGGQRSSNGKETFHRAF